MSNMKEQLNSKQSAAVKELDNNVVLLAPAGTGKTKTIASRIARIIEEKRARGNEILCLTFTNRACKEMKERILSVVGAEASGVVVKTFHSFCFDIIKTEAKKNTDISFDFIVYDEEDCREIIREVAGREYSTSSIQNFINEAKELWSRRNDVTLKDTIDLMFRIEGKMDEICKDPGNGYKVNYRLKNFLQDYGARLIEAYNRTLAERHALDFNDLIINTWNLMENPNISSRWRKEFKYIHVDEVQDTSGRDYDIISKIFTESNVMICGDAFQTIYSWRGSKPQEILSRFRKEKNPVEIVLNQNYRSTEILLEASYEYLKNVFHTNVDDTYKDGMRAMAESQGEKIIYKSNKSPDTEGQWIFENIMNLVQKGKVKDLSRVAVLTRNNKINTELSKVFNRMNMQTPEGKRIGFMLVDEFKFYRKQEIKDITAYLKLLINKNDENSLKRILRRFGKGIGMKTIEDIASKENHSLGIRLVDFLDESTVLHGDPYLALMNNLDDENVVVFDVESTGVNTTEDEIIQIAAIRVNGEGEIVEEFERFIKPQRNVGTSELVHGFSDGYLEENGESAEVVLRDFLAFIRGRIVVGHNVTYDINILSSELSRRGMEDAKFLDYYDTLDIARRFYPNLHNHKLETLCSVMETEVKANHNAMADIKATKDVLMRMIDEKIRDTIMQRMSVYGKYASKFTEIAKEISGLRKISQEKRPYETIGDIVNRSGILDIYKGEEGRINNLKWFFINARELDIKDMSSRDSMIELLRITALSNSEMDALLKKHPRVPIITIHQAKGSEFDYVFMAGLEEYTFPSFMAINSNNIDEEKRLMYVGITRAKKGLFISSSESRNYKQREKSRLVSYIPEKYIEKEDN